MYKKLNCCKYCSFNFKDLTTSERANHSRWCELNPKRKEYVNALANHRQNIVNHRNQFVKAKDEGRPIPQGTMTGKPGPMLGKKHSAETKQHLKEKALASPHRRLVRSIRPYIKKDGSTVMLDSSWEEVLAKRLDELNINWIRSEPIPWLDNDGIKHNYFPDFYLPDYNLYLDPKNKIAKAVQQIKINCLMKQYNNILIIETLDECKNFNL